MIGTRWIAAMSAAAALCAAGCGPRSIAVRQSEAPRQDLIVLLPDANGSVGRVTVSTAGGTVELAGARASTQVSAGVAPGRVRTLSEGDVRDLFGDALAALPPAPQHFTLFFEFDSEELTPESRKLIGDVLQLVKGAPAADVIVLGHTDRTGTPTRNFDLGLRRANKVRAMLVQAGVRRSRIDVTSFGEREPLVKTADGVFEPRNRRVEVTVR